MLDKLFKRAAPPNPAAQLLGPGAMRRVTNRPVLATPEALRTVIEYLSTRKGLEMQFAPVKTAGTADIKYQRRAGNTFHISRGIAVIPVDGDLVHKYASVDPYCGMTGYDGIARKLRDAAADSEVRGILLDFHSPGGEVDGCADLGAQIREVVKTKPVWAIADCMCYSAAFWLASQCDRLYMTASAGVGSVGVVMAHADYSEALKEDGVNVTLIHAGAHKVDGNPYEPLPAEVRDAFQREAESLRMDFARAVAEGRGIDIDTVLASEAACLNAQAALEIGFADGVVPSQSIIQMFLDDIGGVKEAPRFTKAPISPEAASLQPEIEDELDMSTKAGEAAPQAQAAPETPAPVDVAAQAAKAAKDRVTAIVTSPEAKGREAMAQHLALNTDMPTDAAIATLKAAPEGTKASPLAEAMNQVAQPQVGAVAEAASRAAQNATDLDPDKVYGSRRNATANTARG